ncbi:rhamnogalacturonan acetylesterase, partial [Lactobacillus sp. XV13L]|nr:rhamnogalacturonan acetylesterase [Lactobacillus sp. XV13L]
MRYVDPNDFIQYINQYVISALDRKAIPIVISPPPRYHFIEKNRANISFNDYRKKLLEYAKDHDIACIDLGKLGSEYLTSIGPEKSRGIFMKLSYGQYHNFPEGLEDATHFRKLGAMKMADIIAQKLHEIDSKIPYYKSDFIIELS